MKSVEVSRDSAIGGYYLTMFFIFLFTSLTRWWAWLVSSGWIDGLSGALILGGCLFCLWKWISIRRGSWRLHWEDAHILISDSNCVDYDGDVRGLHLIQEDGRGYFLYPNPEIFYRIRRKDSCPELDALLSKFIRQDPSDS
jgi:hypothetical protein